MKSFDWDNSKNELLKKERNISFEDIVVAIENGFLVDRIKYPNSKQYPNQMILFVNINNYIYAVPIVEDEKIIFLKTIFPNRKATLKYLENQNEKT